MDVRVRDLLTRVKELKGFENAVVAGGACRDELLDRVPKDYDIFLPRTASASALRTFCKSGLSSNKSQYESATLSGVFDFHYEGVDFQFMFTKHENNDNLGQKLMEEFDYGICMVYSYDAKEIIRDERYDYDISHGYMSLHKLDSLSDLPKATERFNYLNKKLGGHYLWRCPLIKYVDNSRKDNDYSTKKLKFSKKSTATWIEDAPADIAPREFFRPAFQDLVAQAPNLADIARDFINFEDPRPAGDGLNNR